MNAQLGVANDLSATKLREVRVPAAAQRPSRCDKATEQFHTYTQLLVEAKQDLHGVFRRIRNMRDKIVRQYPAEADGAQPFHQHIHSKHEYLSHC